MKIKKENVKDLDVVKFINERKYGYVDLVAILLVGFIIVDIVKIANAYSFFYVAELILVVALAGSFISMADDVTNNFEISKKQEFKIRNMELRIQDLEKELNKNNPVVQEVSEAKEVKEVKEDSEETNNEGVN